MENLKQIGDGIFVKDLSMDDNISILSNPDDMIVIITGAAPEEIEEEEGLEEIEEGLEEPEVIEKGKKEEDEDTE